MCFNISFTKTAEYIASVYGINTQDIPPLPRYYKVSGFAHPEIPVIFNDYDYDYGKPRIKLMSWGLIPHWIKNHDDALKIAKKTLNARSETISELPSFKYSWKTRRCIIAADGFFEPHYPLGAENGRGTGRSVSYCIKRKDSGIINLGGLYALWQNRETDEAHFTFSIITMPANALLEKIHNAKKRMPVILPDTGEAVKEWLDPELPDDKIGDFFKPREIEYLEAFPEK